MAAAAAAGAAVQGALASLRSSNLKPRISASASCSPPSSEVAPPLVPNSSSSHRGPIFLQEKESSFRDHLQQSVTKHNRFYAEQFSIRCYEVTGPKGHASVETIANLLQEVACNHARSVGFTTDGFATTLSMRKHGLIWVTTRMHVEIEEYPRWGEDITIETWFQFEGRIATRREWIVTNTASGKVLARATSTWALMHKETRRLSRTNDDVKEEFSLYVMNPPRYAFDDKESKKQQIPKLDDYEMIKANLSPRRGDLDMNRHVNNVTYIGWVLESLSSTVPSACDLSSITLEYRRECQHGDIVTSKSSSGGDGLEFVHLLELQDEKEVNRARTTWRKKPPVY